MNIWDKVGIWIVIFSLIFVCLYQQHQIVGLTSREEMREKQIIQAFEMMQKKIESIEVIQFDFDYEEEEEDPMMPKDAWY